MNSDSEKRRVRPAITQHTVSDSLVRPAITQHTVGDSLVRPAITQHTVSDSLVRPAITQHTVGDSLVRPAITQHTVNDSLVNSPRPQLNRSEEDLWTDEELFDNDSFIKATQELFANEGFFGQTSVRQQARTSTPVAAKVGRYTFSLEPPPLSGIASGSQFKHGTLVSSDEKVVKTVHGDHKTKVKVVAAAPKMLPFHCYHDKDSTSSLAAGRAKTRSYTQCRKNTVSTSHKLPDRATAHLHSLDTSTRVTTRTVQPVTLNGPGLTKCQSSAAQSFSKPACRPSSFMSSLTCVNQPSVQSGRNCPGHYSARHVRTGDHLKGEHQPSKKQLPSGACKPNSVQVSVVDNKSSLTIGGLRRIMDDQPSIADDVNFTDMSLSDDLLAAVAEPDDLLDSQECLLNGTQTCGISASQASTLILSSERRVTALGDCPQKGDVASKHTTHPDAQTKHPGMILPCVVIVLVCCFMCRIQCHMHVNLQTAAA